jgi:peptidoglycan/LPS O-acetylase OafA/YrhL
MDGLRGVACLMVVVGHSVMANLPVTATALTGVPKIGVWLFFVLSAFLLTLRLLDRPMSTAAIADYTVARILRIVPPFLLAVLLYQWLGQLGILTLQDALSVMTLRSAPGHLWTIPVEMSFYLLLPLLAFVLQRMRPAVAITTLICIAGAALTIWPPAQTPQNSTFVGWYLSTFLAGSAAAVVVRSRGLPTSSAAGYAALAGVILIAVAFKTLSDEPALVLVDKHWLLGVPLAVLTISIFSGHGMLSKILSGSLLTMVGKASFSIYLIHIAFVTGLAALPHGFGAILAIALSLAAGFISHVLIERPLQSIRLGMARRTVLRPVR